MKKHCIIALYTTASFLFICGCNFEDTTLNPREDARTDLAGQDALEDMIATDIASKTDLAGDASMLRDDMPDDLDEMDVGGSQDMLDMSTTGDMDLGDMDPASPLIGLFIDCQRNLSGEGRSEEDAINSIEELEVAIRAEPLQPGQGIYFRSGSRCEGTLSMIVRDQVEDAPAITISTYGGDAPATIDVSRSMRSWQPLSKPAHVNGIPISYLESAPIYNVQESERVTQIFRKGTRLPLASRSDSCNKRPSWVASIVTNYDSDKPNASRTIKFNEPDNILVYPPTPTMRVVLRLSDFDYGIARGISETNLSDNTINIDDMPPEFSQGYSVEVQNWLPVVTCDGEWMQDGDEVYLFALDLSDIRISTRDRNQSESALMGADGIQLRLGAHAHVEINNLHIERAARAGIWARPIAGQQGQVTVRDVQISDPAVQGINTYGIDSLNVEKSSIERSPSDCIRAGQQTGLRIEDSTFTDCGFISSQDVLGVQLSGISLGNVEDVKISRNTFDRMGFAAVSMSGVTGTGIVEKNLVRDYCLFLNDCGAIYTNGGRDVDRVSDGMISYHDNLILRGFGHIEGTPKEDTGAHSARGVYLDWRRSGVTVDRNTIVDAPSRNGALFIHGGKGNIISRNVIIQRDAAGVAAAVLTNDLKVQEPTPMPDNLLTDNVIYIESLDKGVVRLTDSVLGAHDNRPEGMLRMINNALYNPLSKDLLALDTRHVFGPERIVSSNGDLDLVNGLLSFYETTGAPNATHSRFLVNEELTPVDITLDMSYCALNGSLVSGDITLPERSALVLMRCYCNSDGACNNEEDTSTCPQDC